MNNLIRFALQKPISIMVAILAIVFFSVIAVQKINVDIFPEVESPAIYIAMPYGGLSPEYMDGFMANEFQKVLLFVSGVKEMDFKSIQGLTLMKLTFYPGTDMAQSAAELSTSVSRAMGFLPPGAVPPMVVRFDGSSLPVGKLVFESDQRSINEIQTEVLTKIRPMLVNVPGVSAPAPFGGSARTIVVNADPNLLRANNLSTEDVTIAIAKSNLPSPAGNLRIGDKNMMAPINSLSKGPEEFLNTPIKTIHGRTIYVRDVADVQDEADMTYGYAMVNGNRSVYLPVIKKADASTLDAVQNVKASLKDFEHMLPEDMSVRYEFDQSKYIKTSLTNLQISGLLGAILTGLVVLLFLGDLRGALIVVLTIPISLMAAISVLYLMGQTLNIMTLSGLALSIGILVDEATVTIENIHQHMEVGKQKQRAILDALFEISIPKLLILLSILAVLTPTLIMSGISKDMFLPLSLAVAFAMIASFISSQTFVPILANWMIKIPDNTVQLSKRKRAFFDKFRVRYSYTLRRWFPRSMPLFFVYLIASGTIVALLINRVGTDVMPTSNSGDFQLRIQAPAGDRLEKTEELFNNVIADIKEILPEGAVSITSGFVGPQSPNNPINPIFLFTSSSDQAVLEVSVDQDIYSGSIDAIREKLRATVAQKYPEASINFEPMELTEKIMGQGAMTPIEIKVGARQLKQAAGFANQIKVHLDKVDFLRDIRIAEQIDYPVLNIDIDRDLAGQFDLGVDDITRNLVAATSSTRFTNKNMWIDPRSGLPFQTQVEIPYSEILSETQLRSMPVKKGNIRPVLEDVANIRHSTAPAQVNRKGPNRYVTLIANIHNKDLGSASAAVKEAIKQAGEPPRGVTVWTEGTMNLLDETMSSLMSGLAVALVAIFLMMAAYYQSFKVPMVILSVAPAVFAGSLLVLYLTGSTLNLQSYMGIIMAIGVSVSNTILLVDQGEFYRRKLLLKPENAARLASAARLRPILMTAVAMFAGMLPMAIGIGEGSEQAAPLGRAVIGGLIGSSITILLLIPHFYSSVMSRATVKSVSLDPDDQDSEYYLETQL
ncbi:efflux RND transporter permease subunit [Gelidibacter sp.]|uniref:efflux RND transporter permease subunit n=1 Tax=Gelidibacter sp. TaxID=2018083 RepID=UPI002B711E58|nr:efflux RND transporter permease subunit [Gelidibacter sp.]HUH28625.1 efflux RND transporter permease subunit [Gelidibacter sp.]